MRRRNIVTRFYCRRIVSHGFKDDIFERFVRRSNFQGFMVVIRRLMLLSKRNFLPTILPTHQREQGNYQPVNRTSSILF